MRGRPGERGSVTLWMVGLVMVVFLLGGISIDLWRGLAVHRQVAAVVDAAAVAAGSAIDESVWRTNGIAILDAGAATQLALATVNQQALEADISVTVDVAGDGSRAEVAGRAPVDLTLLAIVVDEGFEVSARATAVPTPAP